MSSKYTAVMRGTLNSRPVHAHGEGTYNSLQGLVNGRYEFDGASPLLDLKVFNGVKVTGYPSICKLAYGMKNPFSEGAYSYNRHIDFGRHGAIWYSAHCEPEHERDGEETCLRSFFTLDGRLDLPKLVQTEDIVETWVPGPAGTVFGQFTIAWLTEDDDYVCGQARTQYVLPKDCNLKSICFRKLRLHNPPAEAANVLFINQESSLSRSSVTI